MKYKNILKILKQQVDDKVQSFWTFDENKKEFTQIYRNYSDKLPIYTPQQLIDMLNEEIQS